MKTGTADTYTLQIGPNHPAFKEPARFIFTVDGERVVDTDIELGYTHRGIESLCRGRNFIQTIYLLERICGICSVSHPVAYCMAVEGIAGIEPPPRAKYIRMIIGELERLHSHLLWAGVAAHEMGFDTLFMLAWDVREKVLDGLEIITGNRINYGMMTIGGVRRDIEKDHHAIIEDILENYLRIYDRLCRLFLDDVTVRLRCRDTGILTREEALSLCAVGPTARASGVARDVRVDHPVNAYTDIEWLKPAMPEDAGMEASGDVYSRIAVRVLEIEQSINIIRFSMANMPGGPIAAEANSVKIINSLKKVQGENMARYEAPRGEVSHYCIMDGRDCPVQLKVKAPTYSNAAAWGPMLRGCEIADIPIVIASIDPCIACADRMLFLEGGRKQREISSRELHRMGVEKMRRMQGR